MARKPKSVNSGDTLGLDVPEGESALEKAHRVMAERRAAGETITRKTPRERLSERPTSKALAIAAKCFDCVGGPVADNGWHRAVRECGVPQCALYAIRPGAKKHAEDVRADPARVE